MFVAIGWGFFALGVPEVASCGLMAMGVATITAVCLLADEAGLGVGLYGCNA